MPSQSKSHTFRWCQKLSSNERVLFNQTPHVNAADVVKKPKKTLLKCHNLVTARSSSWCMQSTQHNDRCVQLFSAIWWWAILHNGREICIWPTIVGINFTSRRTMANAHTYIHIWLCAYVKLCICLYRCICEHLAWVPKWAFIDF